MKWPKVVWVSWDNFWQETSIGALGNAGKARKSPLRRLIWIILFLVGLALTAFSLAAVLMDILTYPVDTSVTTDGSKTKASTMHWQHMIIIPQIERIFSDQSSSVHLIWFADFPLDRLYLFPGVVSCSYSLQPKQDWLLCPKLNSQWLQNKCDQMWQRIWSPWESPLHSLPNILQWAGPTKEGASIGCWVKQNKATRRTYSLLEIPL